MRDRIRMIAAGLVVVAGVAAGHPALAADVLAGLSGEYRALHGHRVNGGGTMMIFLGDDGTTSSVDISSMGNQPSHPLERGQAATLAVKTGLGPNALIAGRVRADPLDPSTGRMPMRPFDSVQGTVEGFENWQIRFRTSDGLIVWADASTMPGRAAVRVNEPGVLTYERGARHATALWLVQKAR